MSSQDFKTLKVGALVFGERKAYFERWYPPQVSFDAISSLWLVIKVMQEHSKFGTRYFFKLKKICVSRDVHRGESCWSVFESPSVIIGDSHFTISRKGGTNECISWSIL
jgi:hypothetical protein